MNSKISQTHARLPRGTRADAETPEAIYLIKHVSSLRATHQVRLLALKAAESGRKLVLMVPPACRFEPCLAALLAAMSGGIRREDLP